MNTGSIEIGSGPGPSERFDSTSIATIDLRGEPEFRSRIPGSLCAGNKILSTVGLIKAYGADRSASAKSRLLTTALVGATTVDVETGLDWVEGDQLHFAPTAMQHTHSDYLEV